MNDEIRLITGIVSNLAVHDGEGDFMGIVRQQAAGLAAAGLAGAASGAGLAVSSTTDSVQFFTCTVGEQAIIGHFSRITFKNGEQISFAVQQERNGLKRACAATRSRDQMLWMPLHCSRGMQAHKKFSMQMFFWLLMGGPLFFILMGIGLNIAIGSRGLDFDLFTAAMCIGNGLIISVYYPIRFYFQCRPVAQRAERIFAVLGYPAPSRVDLPQEHKKYCKAHAITWPYLTDGLWIYHYLDPRKP